MAVIQTTHFICDICGLVESEIETELGFYEDPVIERTGWGYLYIIDGNDRHMVCPDCLDKGKETASSYID